MRTMWICGIILFSVIAISQIIGMICCIYNEIVDKNNIHRIRNILLTILIFGAGISSYIYIVILIALKL